MTVLNPTAAGACVIGLDLSLTGTGIAAIDAATAALSTAVHASAPPAINNLAGHTSRHRRLADGIVGQVVAADPVSEAGGWRRSDAGDNGLPHSE